MYTSKHNRSIDSKQQHYNACLSIYEQIRYNSHNNLRRKHQNQIMQ